MTDARIEDMLIVFRRRYGPLLPDDDCGRDDLELFAQHLAFRRGALVEHLAEFAALYAPWATAEEIAAICEFVGGNRRAGELRVPLAPEQVRLIRRHLRIL